MSIRLNEGHTLYLLFHVAGAGHNVAGPGAHHRCGRYLVVLLSANDYDAELAERYGWINRALPAAELDQFVASLAHRIASFPAAGHAVVKERINAIGLASKEEFDRDGDLFSQGVRNPEAQQQIQAAMKRGLQTHDGELTLAAILGGGN